MSYRQFQRSNSTRRERLSKANQKWLKANHYKNVGWDNVIALYQKINDFIANDSDDGDTLESLFLKADQIGNKYQTMDERNCFQKQLSEIVEEVSKTVDQQFPETDIEYIDFSKQGNGIKSC